MPSVYNYLLRREFETGTKSQVVAAGLAALRCASDIDRDRFIAWGKLVDEDDAVWAELEVAADMKAKDRAAALDRLVDLVLKRRSETSS